MPEQEEKKEEQQEQKEESKEWDKERQRVDQLQANITKLADEKTEMSGQLTTLTEQNQGLAEKFDELKAQLVEKQAEQQEVELDSDLVDPNVIKAIDGIKGELSDTKKQLENSNKQIEDLIAVKTQYEVDQQAKAEDERKAGRKEKILSKLDERYGAKFRNEAMKLAQADVDKEGKPPDGELEVFLLLDKHYNQLSKDAVSGKTKTTVPVDNGSGGVVFGEDVVKEGTREEVLKSMKSWFKKKGDNFTLPTP